jgi:hypothetical protein
LSCTGIRLRRLVLPLLFRMPGSGNLPARIRYLRVGLRNLPAWLRNQRVKLGNLPAGQAID